MTTTTTVNTLMSSATDTPREMAVPGTHAKVLRLLVHEIPAVARILDIGAGEGSMSKRLLDHGYAVEACDLYPELFRVAGVECKHVDAATGALPYEDGSLDAALAVEVVEHLESHRAFFCEVARLLKPGGKFIFTTPNILSLKSRLRFLMTGYFHSHGPLNPGEFDPPRQHITPFTLDRYRFMLSQCGLELQSATTNKLGNTSRMFYWLAPIIRLAARRRFGASPSVRMQNSRIALLGRNVMIVARKPTVEE